MTEVLVKTHLIVKDIYEEYHMKWTGRILDTNPLFENDMPIFVIVGGRGRSEINTTDMTRVEKVAKLMTMPKGRAAVTSDNSRIYIKEVGGSEKLLGIMTHNHIKTYAPMYDKVGWKE